MLLSNRSAAFHATGDHVNALVDAENVIKVRKPWSKGYFRKAKALVGLAKLDEAADTVRLGLQYEPNNTVSATPSILE